jgi:hypothetical protein
MDKELENLEKSFILDEDMEHENIKELIGNIQKYCKIDKNGCVRLEPDVQSIKIRDKIMLILSARHLANNLQKKRSKDVTIGEEVASKELADMLKEKPLVINARLKDLKDDGSVLQISRGMYKVAPYSIKKFLNEIEGNNDE